MSAARMPLSATVSLAAHAAAFGLLVFTGQLASQKKLSVINNVDFIQVKRAVPVVEKSAAKPASSTFDFLKMALPAVQHAPKTMDIKLPDAHKPMQVQVPKLEKDRGRLDAGPKLDMDLDKGKNIDIAKVEARIPSRKVAALAAMPRLEEVGRRRVANLPQAIAMEEKRQEAMSLKGTEALATATQRRSAAAAQPQGLEAAAPSKFSEKIASLLPDQRLEMRQAVMPTPAIRQGIESPVVHERRKPAALEGEAKKGVEIEGPLADRKVTAYEIPEFPNWAKQQGVLEASVAIRFWVSAGGDVLPNMRVEHTSGYGRLDRLAMESLAKWKFAPLATGERQWGVITFRFLLE
jgi:TonB family protein